MKFVVFDDSRRLGFLQDERILDLACAASTIGWAAERCAGFRRLSDLVEQGRQGIDDAQLLVENLAGSDAPGLWRTIDQVCLRAPWPDRRFLLAGTNNPDHIAQAFTNLGGSPVSVDEARARARAAVPSGFWGEARPVMGPGEDILIPRRAQGYFDYEAEPAIILGKQGKDIKAGDIADYVWGVTLVCDWSIRTPKWPAPANPPFMPVKNFDCSKSIGPCVVVDEIDPDDFRLQTLVNGNLRQDFSSSEMVYSFGEVLEYFSQDFTYFPGDVVSGGTGAGTVADQTIPNTNGTWPSENFLQPGDTVEVRSEGIGSLVNQIIA